MINYGNFLNRYKPFPFLMQMAEIKTEIVQCGSRQIKWDEIISEGAFNGAVVNFYGFYYVAFIRMYLMKILEQ